MKNIITHIANILFLCLIWTGCTNSVSFDKTTNTSWVFVANEGNFCSKDYGMDCTSNKWGSITMIDDNGNIKNIENVGNTVNSLEVYNQNLYVIINQDHNIIIYDIKEDGIILQNTISTNNSSPREMAIVDEMIYFTNWNTKDVKILNTNNNMLEETIIPINGRPEDIYILFQIHQSFSPYI